VRLTPADRSTDSRNGLKPLKVRPKPAAPLRTLLQPLPGAGTGRRVAAWKRNGLGRSPRVDVDNNTRRGMGCREASWQSGRGNL
jgi:hypothetical protein